MRRKGLTFARGLRSILRHDPDKIMVGEIRDSETAQIAIQSALTGHLVLTTVHANNVFDVIGRFASMGIDAYNFLAALNCVLAQRLVRMLCQSCRVPVPSRQGARGRVRDSIMRNIRMRIFIKARGCQECHGTGTAVGNALRNSLDLTDEIKEMILAGAATVRNSVSCGHGRHDYLAAVGVEESARRRDDAARDQPCHVQRGSVACGR